MVKKLAIIVLLCILSSCGLEPLYYGGYEGTTVEVNVDWHKLSSKPNGATVYIYKENGELLETLPPFNNPYNIKFGLTLGTFSVLVVNNIPQEFENIEFVDMKNTNTCKSRINFPERIPSNFKNEEMAYLYIPKIEVLESQIKYYKHKPDFKNEVASKVYNEMAKVPHQTIKFKVYVKGLKYVSQPPIATFDYVANEYLLTKEIPNTTNKGIEFVLNNRIIDSENDSNGTITSKLNIYDIISKSGKYIFNLDFLLKDGTKFEKQIDITDIITRNPNHIEVDLEINIPPVKIDDDNMPFDPDVEDWKDIIIDIPM